MIYVLSWYRDGYAAPRIAFFEDEQAIGAVAYAIAEAESGAVTLAAEAVLESDKAPTL